MLTDAFPKRLKVDVEFVISHISTESVCGGKTVSPEYISYILTDGEKICFPYRIYLTDKSIDTFVNFTDTQKIIYHCIFSRSCDGYVREKHIAALLKVETLNWVVPYIIKICDEYILKILELVYNKLSEIDTSVYKEICRLNSGQFLLGYNRMISYWNEYYRDRFNNFCDYVGKKLYEECFGYVKKIK